MNTQSDAKGIGVHFKVGSKVAKIEDFSYFT